MEDISSRCLLYCLTPPHRFQFCKSPSMKFHNLQDSHFQHRNFLALILTGLFPMPNISRSCYNVQYFLSYSLWTWIMHHSLLLCSNILYLWRYVPLESSPIDSTFLYKACISINLIVLFSILYYYSFCLHLSWIAAAAEACLVTQKKFTLYIWEGVLLLIPVS